MKKIFTLMAAFAMALGVSAQQTETFGAAQKGSSNVAIDLTSFSIDGTYNAGGEAKVKVYGSDKGMKLRTNRTDNTIILTINEGITITSFEAGMVTNDASESITLSKVLVDDVATDFTATVLPNTGNANGAAIVSLSGIEATKSISFVYDDSEYTGKNKQIFLAGKLTYNEAKKFPFFHLQMPLFM